MVLSATRRVVSRRARSALSGRCLKPEPSIDRQPDVGRFQAGLPCSAVLSCAQRRSCHRLPDAAAAPAWLGVHEDHVGLRAERAGAGLRAHRAVIADRSSSRTAAGDDRRSQRTRPAGRRSPGLPASRQIIAVTAFDFHAARSLTSPLHRAAAAKTLIIPASASGSSAASAS